MKRLHIGHLRASEFLGGPEKAILGQAASMPQFDFTYISFVRGGAQNCLIEKAESLGLKTAKLSEIAAGDIRLIAQLRRLVREREIDLIVSHDYKSRVVGHIALRFGSAAHIGHFRGITLEDPKVRAYNWIDRVVMRRMKKILTVSRKSASLLEQWGVPPGSIEVIPNAIETDKLLPESYQPDAAVNRRIRIVAAGRLSYEKGYDVLLGAISLLVSQGDTNFQLAIYGHGPEEARLRKQTEQRELHEYVFYAGFVDDIMPVFKAADFLVLPSRSEGMPNVILEAWSQKLAVVSTAVGGVPEMIEHGISGLLAEPDSPDKLAEQLSRAISNRGEMIRFGEAGYNLVRHRYSFEKQAELLRRIYEDEVIGRS